MSVSEPSPFSSGDNEEKFLSSVHSSQSVVRLCELLLYVVMVTLSGWDKWPLFQCLCRKRNSMRVTDRCSAISQLLLFASTLSLLHGVHHLGCRSQRSLRMRVTFGQN